MRVTDRGKMWELRNSLWVLLPVVHLAWLAFLMIGVRAKKTTWIIWGVVYLLLWVGFFVLLDSDLVVEGNRLELILELVAFFGWLIPFAQLLFARREYLSRYDALCTKRAYEEVVLRERLLSGAQRMQESSKCAGNAASPSDTPAPEDAGREALPGRVVDV